MLCVCVVAEGIVGGAMSCPKITNRIECLIAYKLCRWFGVRPARNTLIAEMASLSVAALLLMEI